MAVTSLSGTFGGTGTSPTFGPYRGSFDVSISGGAVATVQVQRSFDDGANWVVVEEFDASSDIERYAVSVTPDTIWRFECTAYTSGTVTYRMIAV